MRFAPCNSNSRAAIVAACVALTMAIFAPRANALVVQDMTGTTVPPADDPGWNYVSTVTQNFVYLGDGWALSALHVGLPTGGLNFNGQSFNMISGQAYTVTNPAGFGSATTDLRMVRINGDPGLAPINIASQPINEAGGNSFLLNQREVVIIGRGPAREANQSRWNVTTVSGGGDIWTESPTGSYTGYKFDTSNSVKRWGKNLIADEDTLFGTGDSDLRGKLTLTLCGGACTADIQSMVTQFDASGLANEAQAVSGDSGSSVFFKRNGVWELVGIVNAVLSPNGTDGQPNTIAVYGGYTSFADLSYYRSEILKIMNDHADYSVMGDINLDGVVNGTTTAGGGATGDLAAFVNGWGYDNGTGVGDVTSWKNGDLNRDGKTDYHDFVLLRGAFTLPGGAGGLTLGSLLGGTVVPEPSSAVILLIGAAGLAAVRRRHQR